VEQQITDNVEICVFSAYDLFINFGLFIFLSTKETEVNCYSIHILSIITTKMQKHTEIASTVFSFETKIKMYAEEIAIKDFTSFP
jgi:hypothetical protein